MCIGKLIDVAEKVKSNDINLIEASRLIVRFGSNILGDKCKDYLVFVLIDSDSDHLPLGSYREHWSGSGLRKADIEINEIERFYKNDAIEAAASIIKQLSEK